MVKTVRPRWLMAGGLVAAVVWAYWTTLEELAQRWSSDPQYSHGWLVPMFALGLLWVRRAQFALESTAVNWTGVLLIGFSLVLRFGGAYFHVPWLDGFSLVPLLAGVAWLLGGRPLLVWAGPSILFLVFMVPLPYRAETALAYPLRRLATVCSTYLLQTIGLPAIAEGNVIQINEARIGVVEACSGLSMLMVFVALAVAVALLINRPLWEKGLILLSAVPIALIANVVRITVTGLLHVVASSEIANVFFHDLAGWLMMPLALVMLWAELAYLSWLMAPATPVPSLSQESGAAVGQPAG